MTSTVEALLKEIGTATIKSEVVKRDACPWCGKLGKLNVTGDTYTDKAKARDYLAYTVKCGGAGCAYTDDVYLGAADVQTYSTAGDRFAFVLASLREKMRKSRKTP